MLAILKDKRLYFGLGFLIGVILLDLITTYYGLQIKGNYELNVFARNFFSMGLIGYVIIFLLDIMLVFILNVGLFVVSKFFKPYDDNIYFLCVSLFCCSEIINIINNYNIIRITKGF